MLAVLEPVRGERDWTGADRLVAFAEEHGQAVRGLALVWSRGVRGGRPPFGLTPPG